MFTSLRFREDMSKFDSRLESFDHERWPKNCPKSAFELASAGFYFDSSIARLDTAKCFHCGLFLNQWKPSDDPWQEHQKFSPDCRYILLNYPAIQMTRSTNDDRDIDYSGMERIGDLEEELALLDAKIASINIPQPIKKKLNLQGMRFVLFVQMWSQNDVDGNEIENNCDLEAKIATSDAEITAIDTKNNMFKKRMVIVNQIKQLTKKRV